MSLLKVWRWYGPDDIVSLDDIQQTGVTGIVTALHQIPVGEVWPVSEIQKRQKLITWNAMKNRSRNLTWSVVESVNVHESIKKGLPERDLYIDNYIQTLKNLSNCGIHVVCYNFMPVLDWTRTNLDFELSHGGKALRFDWIHLALFDLHILQRQAEDGEYSESIKAEAKRVFSTMSDEERSALQKCILAGVPGSGRTLKLEDFRQSLEGYRDIDSTALRSNLQYFLRRVIPEAEKLGIKMCCHPDDPPFSIFGLPRIVSDEADLEFLTRSVDSPSNGLTFCTGSLAPNPTNDLPGIIKRWGHKVHFIHLRNIQREVNGSFYESDHLEGSVNMAQIMSALMAEMERRKASGQKDLELPMRPDHGHQLLDDLKKDIPFPGYSAIGRLKGLAQLQGLEVGIQQSLNLEKQI